MTRPRKQVAYFTVNGEAREVAAPPYASLLETLRDTLRLTGTKRGCDTGDCGACTVLVDGEPLVSCLALTLNMQERDITTIEGLANDGDLHAVQQAFIDFAAVQCGFCTPGMILSSVALLNDDPQPSESVIRDAIAGNLCRCTGYVKVIEAVQAAAKQLA